MGRLSCRKGWARRLRASKAAPCIGWASTQATRCCASTSSGFLGQRTASISPRCICAATTVLCNKSLRKRGSIRARLTSPTPWPARPTRCSPRATLLADSTSSTFSTLRMSIPNSRELVATLARLQPALSASAISLRRCLRLPRLRQDDAQIEGGRLGRLDHRYAAAAATKPGSHLCRRPHGDRQANALGSVAVSSKSHSREKAR